MKISQDRVSKFVVITGPRGSLKSLYMSSMVAAFLIRYYCLKLLTGEERNVWTNYPVGFWYNAPNGDHVYLESKPLNREALMLFDAELAYGWAFIDEMDQWLDRQDWAAVTQKLITKGMTQIRKRKLSIGGSLQNYAWLNGRAEFQTDILVKCRESAFTPWGRKQGVDLGEVGFLTFQDKSGIMTGYQYEENWKEYQLVFQGKRFWNIYDTDFEFDPLESVTKYRLKVPKKDIIVGQAAQSTYDEEPGAVSPGQLRSPMKNQDHVLLSHLVQELVDAGHKMIRTSDFWAEAVKRGLRSNKYKMGQFITGVLKLERTGAGGTYYDLQKIIPTST